MTEDAGQYYVNTSGSVHAPDFLGQLARQLGPLSSSLYDTDVPVAVISGITGGIGSIIAAQCIQAGMATVGITRPRTEKPDTLCPVYQVDITAQGRHVDRVQADIIGRYHRCDLLVLAHGHDPITMPSEHLSTADLVAVLQADVVGSFTLAQAFGKHMLTQEHGCIVFISSLHARQTYPGRVPYAAAKAAVCGMMRSLALEWGPRGVRCNAILPWQVGGERTQSFVDAAKERGEDLLGQYLSHCPTGALVTPQDIASTVLWLAQTQSVNGAEIVLDGGVSASMWYEDFGAQGT